MWKVLILDNRKRGEEVGEVSATSAGGRRDKLRSTARKKHDGPRECASSGHIPHINALLWLYCSGWALQCTRSYQGRLHVRLIVPFSVPRPSFVQLFQKPCLWFTSRDTFIIAPGVYLGNNNPTKKTKTATPPEAELPLLQTLSAGPGFHLEIKL